LLVVTIVVDLLDRDCHLREDVNKEVVGVSFDFILVVLLAELGLTLFVLGDIFGVEGNMTEQLR
jgi:hypothetical protein